MPSQGEISQESSKPTSKAEMEKHATIYARVPCSRLSPQH